MSIWDGTGPTAAEHYAYGRPESSRYQEYLDACKGIATNNHMPLRAYEVAEFNRPINWFAVLVGAALAAFVVFVLGW